MNQIRFIVSDNIGNESTLVIMSPITKSMQFIGKEDDDNSNQYYFFVIDDRLYKTCPKMI